MTSAAGSQWVSLGELTKKGNPWHPLYRSGDTPLLPFDIAEYMAAQN
ncbi:hypothetical protein ACX9R5_07445 [Rathayibacter sp. CAU 1779]